MRLPAKATADARCAEKRSRAAGREMGFDAILAKGKGRRMAMRRIEDGDAVVKETKPLSRDDVQAVSGGGRQTVHANNGPHFISRK